MVDDSGEKERRKEGREEEWSIDREKEEGGEVRRPEGDRGIGECGDN